MGWQGNLLTFGLTQCAHCGDLIHKEEALVKPYFDDRQEEQAEVFCGSSCHQAWYIKRLNETGL